MSDGTPQGNEPTPPPAFSPPLPPGQNPYVPQPYAQNLPAQNLPAQNPYAQAPYAQAPYGQTPYGQAPYAGYVATPLPRSGAAVASLVCGIIGLLGFWFWVPGILSVVAIISGHAAVRSTRRDPNLGGRGMAFAGLIMGYVGVGLVLLQLVFVVGSLLIFGAFVPAIINR